jgi:hypothetical protein
MKKSVITMEVNNVLFYATSSRGNAWSDDINDAKMFCGMARSKEKNIKECLEDCIQKTTPHVYEVLVKLNGKWDYSKRLRISSNDVNMITLRELFLHI